MQLIITKEGNINLNWEDDLVKGSCITHNGQIVHDRLKPALAKASADDAQ
jgi:NAD(P) transhydrogenase subunit alpha